MGETLFLILRRLRNPLLIIIAVISISVAGLANMPGVNQHGHPSTLGYFYAFYIISYTATTIGFGEIPYTFSNAQRAWVIFSIYISAISWTYALGSIFQLTRDQGFRKMLSRTQLKTSVRRITEPFILIVGYGQSGAMLARMLDRIGMHMVIIEANSELTARIDLEEFTYTPPVLNDDARWPETLVDAGLTHKMCQAMVVLSGDDDVVQAVAVGGTALNPSLRILASVCSTMAMDNLSSFKKIEVVNPFETFANNIFQDLSTPEKPFLEEWLTGLPGTMRHEERKLPQGHWVICGFGRFGHYIAKALSLSGSSWTAIDANPLILQEPSLIKKSYSDQSLREAGIEQAVGLVACTDRDAINLSSVMRARAMNPELFIVTRQMHASNASLVEASTADMRFIQADIISHEIRQLITSPLLNRFLIALRTDTSDLAQRTIQLLEDKVDNQVPFLWAFSCLAAYPGLREAFAFDPDHPIMIEELLIHPLSPETRLKAIALMLVRAGKETVLPPLNTPLQSGDKILFAGIQGIEALQKRHLYCPSPLPFIRTRIEPPRSWIFRKWAEKKKQKKYR